MKTLVILHGWQSSKEKWQGVKEFLEKQGIKIIVPDLPGLRKHVQLKRPWDLDDYVEWFKNFSSKICPDPAQGFFLLGHSFGGRIAIKFSAMYPERIKGLILVSSAGIKTASYRELFPVRLISLVVKIGQRFSFLPFYSLFRKVFYRYILRKTDYLKAEEIPMLKETFKKIIAKDLTPYLEKIKVQTLIIWGEQDKITPVSDAFLMNKKIKNSELKVLSRIGHNPYLKIPKKLSEIIINFLRK